MPHTETKLESKEIFDGHVIHVTLDTVRLEDGRTSLREVVHHHGGACVLPIDDEGCIYLVRQFRYALGEEIWELPAGKLEPGEDPFESAKRELSEECGLSADNYTDLGVVYPTVGYDSEKIYLWAATGLHQGRSAPGCRGIPGCGAHALCGSPAKGAAWRDQGQQDPDRPDEIRAAAG